MAAEEKETKEKKEGKKSKGLLIIIIVMVLVILGGGGFAAYKLLLAPSKAKEQTASEEANPEDPLEVAPKKNAEAGVMYEIPSFVVNLADPSGTRYLRVAISLELPAANKQIAGELDKILPKIKDTVISVLTSKTHEELSTPQGKISLKQELLRRINSALSTGKAKDLYLTEFIIQA